MKQTAVDWLLEQYENNFPLTFDAINKAKEMEKEQIMDAYGHGQNNGYVYAFDKAITINREQYYNETFIR